MHLIRTIISTITQSFYSKEFYANLPRKRRAFGIHALIGFLLALQGALFAFFGIQALIASGVIDKAVDVYPKELVVEIKDGIASTNVVEPYYIKLPGATATTTQYLAIIDTRSNLSIDTVTEYDALFVLLQKRAIVESDSGREIIDLAQIKELKLDRAIIDDFATTIRPFIDGLLHAAPFLLLVVVTLGFIAYNAFIAIPSVLIVKLISRFKGFSMPFRQAYRYALFALIPVALTSFVLGMLLFTSMWINLLVFIVIVSVTLSKPFSNQ